MQPPPRAASTSSAAESGSAPGARRTRPGIPSTSTLTLPWTRPAPSSRAWMRRVRSALPDAAGSRSRDSHVSSHRGSAALRHEAESTAMPTRAPAISTR